MAKTLNESVLKRDPIPLPSPRVLNTAAFMPAAWLYEEESGLTVIVHAQNGSVTHSIPWAIVEGCIKRYQSHQSPEGE